MPYGLNVVTATTASGVRVMVSAAKHLQAALVTTMATSRLVYTVTLEVYRVLHHFFKAPVADAISGVLVLMVVTTV